MNPLNHASLEASLRLDKAGIVLETEQHLRVQDLKTFQWKNIPRPSMAEVWRELPESLPGAITDWSLELLKQGDETLVCYFKVDFCDNYSSKGDQRNTNPTDALIDLRIWIEEQKGKKS